MCSLCFSSIDPSLQRVILCPVSGNGVMRLLKYIHIAGAHIIAWVHHDVPSVIRRQSFTADERDCLVQLHSDEWMNEYLLRCSHSSVYTFILLWQSPMELDEIYVPLPRSNICIRTYVCVVYVRTEPFQVSRKTRISYKVIIWRMSMCVLAAYYMPGSVRKYPLRYSRVYYSRIDVLV